MSSGEGGREEKHSLSFSTSASARPLSLIQTPQPIDIILFYKGRNNNKEKKEKLFIKASVPSAHSSARP